MPAMLQEGDYLLPWSASLLKTRGEAPATIAIWNVPERRPEHEFKSALSTHTRSKRLLNSDGKLQTLWREAGRSRDHAKLDANEASDATVKCAWVAAGTVRFQFRRTQPRCDLRHALRCWRCNAATSVTLLHHHRAELVTTEAMIAGLQRRPAKALARCHGFELLASGDAAFR